MNENYTPKVSVIIPVYNVEKYLESCINSIQKQTLKDIEIICVNDGSTDESLEILRKLAEEDPRIVVADQKNAGAGAARNNGVRLARGKYFGFVDSDDLIYEHMYEELYNKAVSTKADLVISGEIETFFDENIYFPHKNSDVRPEHLELDTFTAIEYPELLQNVFLWNRLYLRSFWLDNHLQIPENRKFAEDLLICTQTSVLARRIAYVRGPHYQYRNVRENSLSDSLAKSQKKLDYLIAVQETKDFLKKTDAYAFYARDFLSFTMHLFVLLQNRLTSMKYHKEFFCGMAQILDDEDYKTLDDTWLSDVFSQIFCELKRNRHFYICVKNKFCSLFRIRR